MIELQFTYSGRFIFIYLMGLDGNGFDCLKRLLAGLYLSSKFSLSYSAAPMKAWGPFLESPGYFSGPKKPFQKPRSP